MFILSNDLTVWRRAPARAAVIAAFYGGLIVVLFLVITGALGAILPGPIASKIAYNSEAYFFAVVIAGWIHLRVCAPHIAQRWSVVAAVSGVLLVLTVVLLVLDLPGRIVTLNEASLAAAIMVVYIALPRPLPRRVPWAIFAVVAFVAAVAVATGGDSWVINQAEAVGFVALLPIALDVIDRGILNNKAITNSLARYSFYAILVLEPVLVSVLGTEVRSGNGALALTLEFLGRIHESFFGVLLICIFFAVALGRTGADEVS